ncbi:beta-mannosidase [Paenibacillus faecis]|uniref:beta-mannosidase n=1 Tax=Paenibacillus faecis TaxID=862114 RepID=UPI001B118C1D|nr:glycoside hydrolase family 2 protein [Paenibacillus faecis]GIO86943.1 beta-mannosidase [Paenibacillus faecis]
MEREWSIELGGPWKIQHFEPGEKPALELAAPGLDDRYWIGADVPGDVHSALIRRGIIDSPYYGHNDAKCRWIERKEWWYRTTFTLDAGPDPAAGERAELVFEGLDTFATVFVNGHEVGKTANMLMSHTFDVTRLVRGGWNSLAVKFDPLHLHHRDKEQFEWSSYTKERPWLRKAAMNFGWDWGPRLVTAGVWGKVRLNLRQLAKLEGVYAYTASLAEDHSEAVLVVEAETRTLASGVRAEVELRLLDAEGHAVAEAVRPVEESRKSLYTGRRAKAAAELRVSAPRLWWTHDLGEPYLYRLEVVLRAEGREVDRYVQSFGIRTVELALRDKADNRSFAFVLNGVKIYAKGANWIPADHMIGAIPEERYRELVELSVLGHMNMLRVWAGGIYEKDVFYEECDRQGVLVWQDFAFANALFPDFNRDFMENVRQEVADNVRRLRNRASLALWCGNNEIDWLVDMKSAAGDITGPFYGESIYHELIPELLEELDPARPYWPSSPYGAEDGYDANDPGTGDRHNWQVWHGSVYPRMYGEPPRLDYSMEGVTFKNYKRDLALFSSEFGMHASANRYTLERNIPAGEFYWGSPEMAYRNKDTNHQKGILLMESFTGIPRDIEEYMNFSMLTQAEGLKYGIEHYRRLKPRNSGALVWQLNDSWPGTSWSMIDYELLPKASYYYGRTFFHPLLLSLEHEPGEPLKVWVVNDTADSLKGTVSLKVYRLDDGSLVSEKRFDVEAAGFAPAQRVGELSEPEALAGAASAEEVLVELTAQGFDAPANRYYLRDPKDLRLPQASLAAEIDREAGTVTVTAAADRGAARLVKLELPLGRVRYSDNYFDLLPGESRIVEVRHPEGLPLPWDQLRVSALNE